mmetsp:Transcript_2469/g.7756  ORF Transcript_2469/g.7756 Transcript_2469/m.7756 type:complete len:191 (+) Transcript_2469:52-624(+)
MSLDVFTCKTNIIFLPTSSSSPSLSFMILLRRASCPPASFFLVVLSYWSSPTMNCCQFRESKFEGSTCKTNHLLLFPRPPAMADIQSLPSLQQLLLFLGNLYPVLRPCLQDLQDLKQPCHIMPSKLARTSLEDSSTCRMSPNDILSLNCKVWQQVRTLVNTCRHLSTLVELFLTVDMMYLALFSRVLSST